MVAEIEMTLGHRYTISLREAQSALNEEPRGTCHFRVFDDTSSPSTNTRMPSRRISCRHAGTRRTGARVVACENPKEDAEEEEDKEDGARRKGMERGSNTVKNRTPGCQVFREVIFDCSFTECRCAREPGEGPRRVVYF